MLDFSRNVHEDLSNYDPNGAWAVMLDEFVEHLRASNGMRKQSEDGGASTSSMDMVTPSTVRPMIPHCGSKRRGLDVDLVAEQLGAMPALDAAERPGGLHTTPKRLCMADGVATSSPTVSMAISSQSQQGYCLEYAGPSCSSGLQRLADQEMSGPPSCMLVSAACAAI